MTFITGLRKAPCVAAKPSTFSKQLMLFWSSMPWIIDQRVKRMQLYDAVPALLREFPALRQMFCWGNSITFNCFAQHDRAVAASDCVEHRQATVASQMATSDCCVTNAFIEQWKGWFIFVSCCLIFFRNIIKPGSFLCSHEKTNNAVETFQIIVFDCLILNRFFRTWMIIGSFVREWLQTIVTYLSIAIRFSNRRFVATYVSLVRWDNCAGHPVGPALDFSTFITRHSKPSIYFMFNRICICNNFKKLKYLGKVLDFPNGSVCFATSHLLI